MGIKEETLLTTFFILFVRPTRTGIVVVIWLGERQSSSLGMWMKSVELIDSVEDDTSKKEGGREGKCPLLLLWFQKAVS